MPCPYNWLLFDDKCIYYSSEPKIYNAAKDYCISYDAELINFKDPKEWNLFLNYSFEMDRKMWTGFEARYKKDFKRVSDGMSSLNENSNYWCSGCMYFY